MTNKRLINLNRDLDKYINKRRKDSDFDDFPIKKIEKQDPVLEIKETKVETSSITQKNKDMTKEAQEDFETIQIEEKETEKPFFSRLVDKFFRKSAEDEEVKYQATPVVEAKSTDEEKLEDLKKALKIALFTMERMDARDFDKFKKSGTFQEYKSLLEKYNIKKL